MNLPAIDKRPQLPLLWSFQLPFLPLQLQVAQVNSSWHPQFSFHGLHDARLFSITSKIVNCTHFVESNEFISKLQTVNLHVYERLSVDKKLFMTQKGLVPLFPHWASFLTL